MSGLSSIEWTDKTWNPTTGCTRVSPGCKNCYAFQLHDMRHAAHIAGKKVAPQYAKPFKELQLFDDRLTDPLGWRKPCRVFVNSMSDLFHKDVPDEFIDRVFAVMALAPQHTFQVLTKRPERMAAYFMTHPGWRPRAALIANAFEKVVSEREWTVHHGDIRSAVESERRWPLPNVWLGTSVENQAAADERIPHLLKTPAAVRFLSCEPLLGPVDLEKYLRCPSCKSFYRTQGPSLGCWDCHSAIDWCIVGGESGPGARPCNVAWVRSIVEQCKAAGAPVFVKQLGSLPYDGNRPLPFNTPCGLKEMECRFRLRDKKGGSPEEWPADLRIREFPKAVPA